MDLYDLNDFAVFQDVILNEIPLIDLRAPLEYRSGSLPGAVNLPIMTDDERHQVGICYKHRGREEAIKLGSSLVAGENRAERIEKWLNQISAKPETKIYCSRGGLRSRIAREWIQAESSYQTPRLKGGYKAFRGYLLEHLNPDKLSSEPIVIGGRTGTGKTILINRLNNSIDLEALANHRGSSFGKHITSQPGQADFENDLAAALIRHESQKLRYIIVEDEGKHIGKRWLPKELSQFFAAGRLIIVEASLAERTDATCREYVVNGQKVYQRQFGPPLGMVKWQIQMESGIDRIAKRLGPARYRRIKQTLQDATRNQEKKGEFDQHRVWIGELLRFYYDPMYDYQLGKDERDVIFRGNAAAVHEYLISMG